VSFSTGRSKMCAKLGKYLVKSFPLQCKLLLFLLRNVSLKRPMSSSTQKPLESRAEISVSVDFSTSKRENPVKKWALKANGGLPRNKLPSLSKKIIIHSRSGIMITSEYILELSNVFHSGQVMESSNFFLSN